MSVVVQQAQPLECKLCSGRAGYAFAVTASMCQLPLTLPAAIESNVEPAICQIQVNIMIACMQQLRR